MARPDPPNPATKRELRARLRDVLNDVDASQMITWAEALTERVLALPEVAGAASVFVYVSIPGEVDTHGLISHLLAVGKQVCVPRVDADRDKLMEAVAIDGLAALRPGPFGVPSPPVDATRVDSVDVALIPGMGFDPKHGTRLGRGAGHYDRWLTAHRETTPIGLAYGVQLVEGLPVEPHDVPMKAVVTEAGGYRGGMEPRT